MNLVYIQAVFIEFLKISGPGCAAPNTGVNQISFLSLTNSVRPEDNDIYLTLSDNRQKNCCDHMVRTDGPLSDPREKP